MDLIILTIIQSIYLTKIIKIIIKNNVISNNNRQLRHDPE